MQSVPSQPHTLDFYRLLSLSPTLSSDQLGEAIADLDDRMEASGIDSKDPRRKNVSLAYAVLGDDAKRDIYDRHLQSGSYLSVRQLEYLGSFGKLPDAVSLDRPIGPTAGAVAGTSTAAPVSVSYQEWKQPFNPAPRRRGAQVGFAVGQPMNPGVIDPLEAPDYSSAQLVSAQNREMEEYRSISARANAAARGFGHTVDFLVSAGLATTGVFAVESLFIVPGGLQPDSSGMFALYSVLAGLIMTLYFVLGDAFGGTLGKRMLGYKVRNIDTGKNLGLVKATKRNWFRALTMIPYFGWLATAVISMPVLLSISPKRKKIGTHDQLANAEVVKSLPAPQAQER